MSGCIGEREVCQREMRKDGAVSRCMGERCLVEQDEGRPVMIKFFLKWSDNVGPGRKLIGHCP